MTLDHLGVIAFGGSTHAGTGSAAPVTEIWECHIALAVEAAPVFNFDQTFCDTVANLLNTWFQDVDTRIASTESLDYVKANEFSLLTGRQITDPTVISLPGGNRGGASNVMPVSTSFRVSLDDSTRNPRHRGGFYPPKYAGSLGDDGRIYPSHWAPMVATTQTLLDGINTACGGVGAIGVWSRRDKAVHVANRFRIGDVPDNISRRRNHLREGYLGGSL